MTDRTGGAGRRVEATIGGSMSSGPMMSLSRPSRPHRPARAGRFVDLEGAGTCRGGSGVQRAPQRTIGAGGGVDAGRQHGGDRARYPLAERPSIRLSCSDNDRCTLVDDAALHGTRRASSCVRMERSTACGLGVRPAFPEPSRGPARRWRAVHHWGGGGGPVP